MDKGGDRPMLISKRGVGGPPMWIFFLNNIIIKCRIVDKGG